VERCLLMMEQWIPRWLHYASFLFMVLFRLRWERSKQKTLLLLHYTSAPMQQACLSKWFARSRWPGVRVFALVVDIFHIGTMGSQTDCWCGNWSMDWDLYLHLTHLLEESQMWTLKKYFSRDIGRNHINLPTLTTFHHFLWYQKEPHYLTHINNVPSF
jgi:hypothetical protein